MMKPPKASITWPAASVPSWPCVRMRRVVARLSDSRSIVTISRTVGKVLKSSGFWMNSTTIRIRTETVIEKARLTSSSQAGIGRIRTVRMQMRPAASAISPRRSVG